MFSILDGLATILGPIATIGKDRRELKDQALSSISNALMETKLYYGKLSRGMPRNIDTEGMLAKYWAAAAIPMRHFNGELAEACHDKSEFWVNPDSYSDKDLAELGIRLQDVSGAYRKMISFRKT